MWVSGHLGKVGIHPPTSPACCSCLSQHPLPLPHHDVCMAAHSMYTFSWTSACCCAILPKLQVIVAGQQLALHTFGLFCRLWSRQLMLLGRVATPNSARARNPAGAESSTLQPIHHRHTHTYAHSHTRCAVRAPHPTPYTPRAHARARTHTHTHSHTDLTRY